MIKTIEKANRYSDAQFIKILNPEDVNWTRMLLQKNNIETETFQYSLDLLYHEEIAFNIRNFFENENYEGGIPDVEAIIRDNKESLSEELWNDDYIIDSEAIYDVISSFLINEIGIKLKEDVPYDCRNKDDQSNK